jgi:hypothetical protein
METKSIAQTLLHLAKICKAGKGYTLTEDDVKILIRAHNALVPLVKKEKG